MNHSTLNCQHSLTSGCRKSILFPLVSTKKSATIERLRKNINVPRRQSTGVLLAPVFFPTAFSSASIGSAISVVGLPATIPLDGVGGAFALASSGLIITSKKLDSKIKKHQEIVTLAIAKRDTVDRLVSKALADNQISDSEFQLIMNEYHQYNVLKEAVRAKLTRQSSRPDVEKIKKNRSRFSKKHKCSHRRFELTFQKFNAGFHLSVTRL